MKKIMTVLLIVFPMVSIADMGLDLRNQMLDSEIEKYTKTRDEKYAALQQCEKSTKGFKIAGITTLVATGVGVAVNVKLASDLKKVNSAVNTQLGLNAKSADQKAKDLCDTLCIMYPDTAKEYNCNC